VNIAWAFLAIVLSIIGFYFFGESWSVSQMIGVVCILGGVCFLSYYHHHIGWASIGLLVGLGLLYAPSNAVQKAALFHGEVLYTTVFWQLASRECFSFLFPWCLPNFRRKIGPFLFRISSFRFWAISFIVIITYFLGMYLLAEAYKAGPISLVSVVGNIQPFTVLLFAWVLWKLFPKFASKEFFDSQAVAVKLLTFLIVFAGLGLLVIS
jgi:drug/metabolite transporter (DMT)-like permease